MAEIFIPFSHGQSEAVDAKLLPQGMFLGASDVRYSKDARMVTRSAYRYDAAASNPALADIIACAHYGAKSELAMGRKTNQYQAALTRIHSAGAYKTKNLAAGTCFGVVERVQSAQTGIAATATWGCVDSIAVGSVVYVIASGAYTLATKAALVATNTVYRIENGVTTASFNLSSAGISSTSNISNAKLAINNGVLCVFWADSSTNTIQMTSLTLASLANVTGGFGGVTVVTSLAGKANYFDVAAGASSTETYLVYMSAALTLRFGTVSSVGVFTQLSTIAGGNAELRPSISATGFAPTDQVVIVWNDGATFATGTCKYTVYRRSTTSFLIGTTTVTTNGQCTGYPVVSPEPSTNDWIAYSNQAVNGASDDYCTSWFATGSVNALGVWPGLRHVAKPFIAFTGTLYGLIGVENDDPTVAYSAYHLLDASPLGNPSQGTEAVFGQWQARPGDAAAVRADPRVHVTTGLTATGRAPGALAIAFALPLQSVANAGWGLFTCDYGDRGDGYAPARLNGELLLSGGAIRRFDGNTMTDSGFATPLHNGLSIAGAGGIANGTYQIVFLYEWFDAGGRRHRSAPSLPASITVAAGPSSINVGMSTPRASGVTVRARIYRTTLAQPTIFTDALGYAVDLNSPTLQSFPTITASDASIAANATLYTQGQAGGLSGLLENDRPPAAKYICAGSDRLMVGGLEDPTAIQWSKLVVPGEPMQWTDFAAYKATVDGRVTAVAEMDGTWFAFTYDAIWTITGRGPNDNGASGSFNEPHRLPSDVGCISHKSLVLTGKGLIFQAATDRLYILPRGSSEPQPIGWQVRDTLTAFPYVAASAFNQVSNVAYWAVTNTAGTAGRLLVYDTRLGEWYVDNVQGRAIKALSIYDGKLTIDGAIYETPGSYQDSDGSTTANVVPVLTTGDIRPFGMSGRGRLRKVTLLAEARDVVTALSVSIAMSYDSGKSFSTPITWPISSLALAIGDAFEADCLVQYPRGDAYRLQLTLSTPGATEGIVWHGLSLEAYAERGLNRQAAARRA